MQKQQVDIPAPPQGRHVGVPERTVLMFGYCLFALATGSVMAVANILLTTFENLLALSHSLVNLPASVDLAIVDQNAALANGNKFFGQMQEFEPEDAPETDKPQDPNTK